MFLAERYCNSLPRMAPNLVGVADLRCCCCCFLLLLVTAMTGLRSQDLADGGARATIPFILASEVRKWQARWGKLTRCVPMSANLSSSCGNSQILAGVVVRSCKVKYDDGDHHHHHHCHHHDYDLKTQYWSICKRALGYWRSNNPARIRSL